MLLLLLLVISITIAAAAPAAALSLLLDKFIECLLYARNSSKLLTCTIRLNSHHNLCGKEDDEGQLEIFIFPIFFLHSIPAT